MSDADTAAPPRLRGHHLICLQFFRGEGYSEAFVANLADVVMRANAEPALVVQGADDVCAACPGLGPDGTCRDPEAGETEVRRLDALALETLGLAEDDRVSLSQARKRLTGNPARIARWRAEACVGCAWESVCADGWKQAAENAS
ncbi:MAG: DUF1284 domain-containing protein [Coriobacteriia bacterium]|nr:DUF1284 domain-containing protein [Coriobacteriia bacterium]